MRWWLWCCSCRFVFVRVHPAYVSREMHPKYAAVPRNTHVRPLSVSLREDVCSRMLCVSVMIACDDEACNNMMVCAVPAAVGGLVKRASAPRLWLAKMWLTENTRARGTDREAHGVSTCPTRLYVARFARNTTLTIADSFRLGVRHRRSIARCRWRVDRRMPAQARIGAERPPAARVCG